MTDSAFPRISLRVQWQSINYWGARWLLFAVIITGMNIEVAMCREENQSNQVGSYWATFVNSVHPFSHQYKLSQEKLENNLKFIPNFNAGMVVRAGYHSDKLTVPDQEIWVQIDLGFVQEIDSIAMVPAFLPDQQKNYEGYGFPVRFVIEVSDHKDFENRITVADERSKDFANPGKYPVIYHQKVTGRYVRVTATKLYEFNKEYLLALSEMMVICQGQNVALWCDVQGSHDTNLFQRWSTANLTDNISYLPVPTNNQQSSTNGFRYVVDETKYPVEMTIDLGKVMPVDVITIYPAVHKSLPSTPSLGMPGKFEILISSDAEFNESIYYCRFLTTNINHWFDQPLSYSSKTRHKFGPYDKEKYAKFPANEIKGRYIKISIKECDLRAKLLSFSEIEVISNYKNVAPEATFSFSEIVNNNPEGWDINYLKDGYTSLYKITNLTDWFSMIQQRRVIEAQLLLIEDQLARASQQVFWGMMLCLVGCFSGIGYYYVSVLKRKNRDSEQALLKLRQDLAADLHDDIGSNLSSINLLVENFLLDHEQDLAATELARIKEVSLIARETAEAMRDVLWLVKHQERTLTVFLQHLRNVYQRVPGSFESRFEISGLVPEIALDFAWQRDMYLVIKELLNNSLRHSRGDQVSCLIECDEHNIKFKLADNGRLIQDLKIEQGHGIRNALERVTKHGGEMKINSGVSMEIELNVPINGQIIKSHLLNTKTNPEINSIDFLHEKTTAGEKVIV